MPEATSTKLDIEKIVNDVLGTIDREREREIIARRFGLFDRKETLEQIGELLGITRERVRQLEKAVVLRLKAQAEQAQLPHISATQDKFSKVIGDSGKVSRVTDLSAQMTTKNSPLDQARISFLATLCPELVVIEDNDHYHQAVGLKDEHNEKKIKDLVDKLVEAIAKLGQPARIEKISAASGLTASHTKALASVSKNLATLNDHWGLMKWPMVNPKNIRDKIYVILHQKNQHMHFNDIAEAIKDSSFKRKDVTTQAIHNELIKDKRFVLIGRGIYALKEWGYD
ncbi:MAG TPA: sigma factor-like helix-turn-helix DNA-binding protein, partial [Patescibacteria group bacterium]|nr:sigma factor-like helix-turn-helix DNA-binding protein [Patescibacteria group bacterium]